MDDLISSVELGAEFDLEPTEVEALLDGAGLPARRVKFGSATATVYDRDAAVEALTSLVPEKAPPLDPALIQELEELRKKVASVHHLLGSDLNDIEGKIDTALAGLTKLAEQNVLLLRSMQTLRDDLTSRVEGLQKMVLGTLPAPSETSVIVPVAPAPAPTPPRAAQVKHNPEPPSEDKLAKRRIGIVGLLASQEQIVRKEFDDAFDLRFFTSDQAKGKSFQAAAGNCERVLVMTAFINHRVEHSIAAAKGTLVRVAGGVTSVRDELHKIFASKPEEVATA